MPESTAPQTADTPERRHFGFLLIALLLLIVVSPLLPAVPPVWVIRDLIATATIAAALWAVGGGRRILLAAAVLALLAVLTLWGKRTLGGGLEVPHSVLTITLLGLVSYTILRHVVRSGRVTVDLVFASLCVYLLIGSIWAHLYLLVQRAQAETAPFGIAALVDGESLTQGDESEALDLLMYHSFVTMTTLGYGDITPRTELARRLCMLQAIGGQLYLVVLVASLVGMHISERRRIPGD